MMNFPPHIEDLVKQGIEITVKFSDDYGIYFDLNTRTKSHVHLVYNEKSEHDDRIPIYTAYMRYDKEDGIRDYSDILYCVKYSMCGRDFIAPEWEEILVKEEILKVKYTTTKSYS